MSVTKFIESKTLAITILGDFTPAIFQPFWLAKKNLIREEEAQETDVKIIHNELVNYDLEWAKVEVRPDKFQISTTSEPYFSMVRDLVIGIFTYLKETPVRAIGINYWYKLGLQTPERFYDFGNKLAPLSNWSFLNDARVVDFEILERERSDKVPGHYRIKIQSDQTIAFGVSVLFNNHINVENNKKSSSSEVVKIMNDNWQDAAIKAEKYIDQIWLNLSS